jgi:hypothetical protein
MTHKLALSVSASSTLLLLPLLGGCGGGGGGSTPVDLGPIGAGLTFIGLGIVLSAIISLFSGPKK